MQKKNLENAQMSFGTLINKIRFYSIIFFGLPITFSCNNREQIIVIEKKGDFYIEKYRINGYGVYGGDVYSDYITDSISFRCNIGKHYDLESYKYSLYNDTFYIQKIYIGDTIKVLNEFIYSVYEMKKNKIKE